jgi:hypothetical protein
MNRHEQQGLVPNDDALASALLASLLLLAA